MSVIDESKKTNNAPIIKKSETILVTSHNCSSCKKVREWLRKRRISFKEINISNTKISESTVRKLLNATTFGTSEIISSRSKYLTDNKIDVDDLKISQLVSLVMENPTILRRPILLGDKRGKRDILQVGWSEHTFSNLDSEIVDNEKFK